MNHLTVEAYYQKLVAISQYKQELMRLDAGHLFDIAQDMAKGRTNKNNKYFKWIKL